LKKLTTRQLSQYLAVTKRTIQRRAIKEHWPFDEQAGLGGTKRLYTFATLPEKVKTTVIAAIIASHEQLGHETQTEHFELDGRPQVATQAVAQDVSGETEATSDWLAQHSFSQKIDPNHLNKDYVKLTLLTLARSFVSETSEGKIKSFDLFCQQYNDQTLPIDKAIYSVIKRISRISLLRWEKKEQALSSGQAYQVSDRAEIEVIDKELHFMTKEIVMVSPTITARRLRQHFLTFFSDKKIPNERQLGQWIRQYST
jgi:hypothetical protein